MFQYYDAEGGDGSIFKAVYSDGLNTVRVAGQPADKSAELAAAVTALNALYGSVPKRQYAIAFLSNYKTIFNAFYTFSEAFRTAGASPTLAEYRSALGSTLAILLTLPASFTTELAHEQAGLGLPSAPTSAWTQAQCQGWHQLLGGWLGRAMAAIALAKIANELD